MATESLRDMIILFLIAAVLLVISFFSFKEKGFLFNNNYIFASKHEREHMDKRPWYQQTAVSFFFMGLACTFFGLSILFNDNSICYGLGIVLTIVACGYAIIAQFINM